MHRDELDRVQIGLRSFPGVSVLVYDQTCATEKRRRRKRGAYPDPARRVIINDQVCEGCGDCSQKSNCLSVEPLETEFGRKRVINQSSCNKDFSCLNGFCQSFVTVEGGKLRAPRRAEGSGLDPASIPSPAVPAVPALDGAYGIFVAGVGGTGVVTIGQLLGVAAHVEGKSVSVLDMAGLAQKGGAVYSHAIIAQGGEAIRNTRIAMGDADLVLCGDLVVGSSPEALARMRPGRTRALLNSDVTPTAAFIGNPDWCMPGADLRHDIDKACGAGRVESVDATELAVRLLGDAVYANPIMIGFAWQKGWIPLQRESLERAITLNDVQVEKNLEAFHWGRRAAHDPGWLSRLLHPGRETDAPAPGQSTVIEFRRSGGDLEQLRDHRAAELRKYQNAAYARRYEEFVDRVATTERTATGTTRLATAVARYLYKLMAYKDEFEVARLYSDGEFLKSIASKFEGDWSLRFYLAPPLLARKDDRGHLVKRPYGASALKAFKILAALRGLRGTWFDPFGRTAERRAERALIGEYCQTIENLLPRLSNATLEAAVRVASVPEEIRGYGHVKEASMVKAAALRIRCLEDFDTACHRPSSDEAA